MALYQISGVWISSQKVITHYAIHFVNENSVDRAVKISKHDAITLLENTGNRATTCIWNYQIAGWQVGELVEVINSPYGKYLRSNPDNALTDNLAHLIDFDWISQ